MRADVDFYPLKFYEIYKPKLWGGRAIETAFGKLMPEGKIGESWEISDHFDDVSIIRNGSLEGTSLRELWRAEPSGLLGEELAGRGFREFPLLAKFIDADAMLSVQAHPDDEYAARCDSSGESGKDEAWYVVSAAPGAELVAGLKEGVSREDFRGLLEEGRVEESLNYLKVAAGDVVHVSPGTVHAIGPGILILEIQQTSDATYRVWDWGRVGDDGRPRELHIEHAFNVIDFARGPVGKVEGRLVSEGPPREEMLDACGTFVIERFRSSGSFVLDEPADRFRIMIFLEGSGSAVAGGRRIPFEAGDTVLVPAALGAVRIEPAAETSLLYTYIPPPPRG